MRLNWVVSIVLLIIVTDAAAQSDSTRAAGKEAGYYNQFFTGALVGKRNSGTAFSTAMVHGYRFSRFFSLGLGVGYDDYGITRWRTIPFFASASFLLMERWNSEFDFILLAGNSRARFVADENSGWNVIHRNAAFVAEPAIAWRKSFGRMSVYAKAGFRMQTVRYLETPRWGWGYERSLSRQINRATIQLGLGWN